MTLLWAGSAAFAADDRSPAQLLQDAEKLTRKAQDLKEQGAAEEALKAARQAEELRTSAHRRAQQTKPKKGAEGIHTEQKEHIKRLHAKLEDLVAAGQMEQVARLKSEIAELKKAHGGTSRKADLAEAKEHLAQLRQHLKELHAQGRHEEAGYAEEKARIMKKKIQAAGQEAAPRKKNPKSPALKEASTHAVELPRIHDNAVPHNGSVVEYWPDGAAKSKRTYRDGRIINAIYYASNGKTIYQMSESANAK